MKANLKQIRKHRKFSEDFKKELVSTFEKGEFSIVQLEKLYGIGMRQSIIGYINIQILMKKALEL